MGQASSKDDDLDLSKPLSKRRNLELRRTHLAPALKLHYATSHKGPLRLLSGHKQYLTADDDNKYLDCVNNVAHVGHAHPLVQGAVAAAMTAPCTNTRYLHPHHAALCKRLLETMPAPLDRGHVFLVNSGSEANDLALRLCRPVARSSLSHSSIRPERTRASGSVFGDSQVMMIVTCFPFFAR